MTPADEKVNQTKDLKFDTYNNFSMYMNIPVQLNICQKLIIAEFSKNIQPIWVELSLAWSDYLNF